MNICHRGHARIPQNMYKNRECKICHSLYGKTLKCKTDRKRYSQSLKGRAAIDRYFKTLHARFLIGKRNAKQRHKIYMLSFKEYKSLIADPCVYCGCKIETGHGLDRMDNKKGYIFGNVVSCCGNCNRHKSFDWTYEEMQAAALAVCKLKRG